MNQHDLVLSFDALTIGVFLCVAVALKIFPGLWTALVGGIDAKRIHSLDGARGLLTVWVLSHHLLMVSNTDVDGTWHAPEGALGVLLTSDFFVAPFFMLTAMLFGGRLLARPGHIGIRSLAIGRVFRLVPAYTVAVTLFVLGALVATKFVLHVPLLGFLKQIGRWMLFDFVTRYDINGLDLAKQYGILWTLRFEILFYCSLPLLALFQRVTRQRFALVAGLLVVGYWVWPFKFFAAGAVASMGVIAGTSGRARIAWQVAAVLGIAAITIMAAHHISSYTLQAICLIPTFVCLAIEVPLVKPFGWRPLRLVGEVSYGNYVLHGPIIFLLSMASFNAAAVMILPPVERTLCLLLLSLIALAGAMLCFVFIERPCMRLGARLAKRYRLPPSTPVVSVREATGTEAGASRTA